MSLENIRIVLVRPMYAGNVGSVCRAMKNMGLSQLVIAGPRGRLNEAEARMMAAHAGDVLAARREVAAVAEAVADCGLVAGTTSRPGLYRDHARAPREWAPRLLEAAAAGPVAVLFGPEDNGLDNDDIAFCTQFIQIPSSEAYPSLNLAQAVMVCGYELFVASGAPQARSERTPEAPSRMRERMFEMWREMLLDIGFMREQKADHMMLGLRRIFSRGRMTEADANILMGVARQTLWMASQYRRWKREAKGAAAAEGPSENAP